jgi:hypothetical protein
MLSKAPIMKNLFSTIPAVLKAVSLMVFSTLMIQTTIPLKTLAQTTYTFTNCTATGRTGPTQTQVNAAYSGSSLAGAVTINTQGIQEWTVPVTGVYTIQVQGAGGGANFYTQRVRGGYGAVMVGDFNLTAGQTLKIVVGQRGLDGTQDDYATTSYPQEVGGSGGGGTYVMTIDNNPLIVAGGGGGATTRLGAAPGGDGLTGTSGGSGITASPGAGGTNGSGGGGCSNTGYQGGSGGGGITGNGGNSAGNPIYGSINYGGYAFTNNSTGGIPGVGGSVGALREGGFGGGGCGGYTGGGGGGYSGGGAGGDGGSGGGGSYSSGTNPINTAGVQSGNGLVTIIKHPGNPIISFNYTGTYQTWTVPGNVTSVIIEAWGAQGGTFNNAGGIGGYSTGKLNVSAGQVLYLFVGQQPTNYTGGYNGGGSGTNDSYSRGGGGASDVRLNGIVLNDRIIVAGGGGGATNQAIEIGGMGGGLIGGDGRGAQGYIGDVFCGHGGTQNSGGAGSIAYGYSTAGTFGQGGNAISAANGLGGGGGGGWFGGGGGDHGGGGGGSSYVGGVLNASTTSGLRLGNGLIIISQIFDLPSISTSGSLSSFSSCSGTASTEQSFTTSGSWLTANITVTAPTGFELSTTSGGSFSNPLTLTESGGSVANTTIFVRMAASATGTPSGNITLASTGATTQNMAVSGTVSSPPTVNAGDDQTVSTAYANLDGNISGSATTGIWSGGVGTYSPNNTTLTASYTPTAAERLAGSLTLTLTSADPEGPCGSVSDNVILTFSAASKISIADGNWETDATWSPSGVPMLIDNVTINHTVTVNSSQAAEPAICNNLAINSGKLLTVASGKALTINGGLSNPAGATLTVASGGSLITYGSISNNGSINIQRTITKDRWHLISSPLTDATAQVFENDYLQSWSEVNAEWTDIISTGTALNPVQGYGLWTMYSSDHTYTFTGTPNTGSQNIELTVSDNFPDPGTGYDGANLLGNPYPSAIDWSLLDNTFGAVYYWQGNGTDGDGTYLSWNNGSGQGSQYIAPAQGFFVVAASAGTISLTNAHRTHSVGSYYKSATDTKDNLLVLETISKGISDKLYVNFDTETSEDFDLQYDAYKFPSGTPGLSELYSYADDKKLSIDVRPESELIQLGFANSLSGTYSIGINQANAISRATLEDTKTNTFTDLLKGSYSFTWLAGEDDKRFKLHWGTVGLEETPDSEIAIYSYHKTAYIKLKNQIKGDIYIYNMAGQLLTSQEAATGLVSLGISAPGIYIVKVVSNKKTTTAKIFIQ